ncbi:MAG: B12-binding domain-containing radical SAM protein [Alphaproteobacteria bacterium]|nr:B12-binding domain-containing radical SAM protein [Alphaproteobacteria bacterium]
MRIGMIAMSGVRVVNKDLAAAGLTLPQFVNRGEVVASLPSLALTTLAGVTPDDVHVEYIEASDPGNDALRTDFDLIAISSYTAMAYEMYALADRYRAAGMPVVLGGLHASFTPHESIEHADAVALGEAETTWPQIVEDFRNGGKAGLKRFYRETHPGTYDLENAPMPRYELLEGRPYNRITLQTVRGCPLDCEFCGASKLYGPKYRRKPVAKVVAEIARICEIWGDRAFIELADDNSFANPRWALDFVDAIRDFDLRWFTETDISLADNDALLSKLYGSGCRQVLIGLESVNPDSLQDLDRANWKRKRLERYIDSIKKIQDHGITVNGCFILGNDHDDEGVFDEVREFIERSELLECQITILTPFPGTRLLQRLRRENRLLKEDFWNQCTLFDVTFQPKKMSVERLEQGIIDLMRDVYNEQQFTARKRRYVEIVKGLMRDGETPEAK